MGLGAKCEEYSTGSVRDVSKLLSGTLRIRRADGVSVPYFVQQLTDRGWQIRNSYSGEIYGVDVVARRCDCGNHEWKREGKDPHGCKHVRAVRRWIKENG